MAYTVEQLAPGSFDVLLDGVVIASLVRNVHRSGPADTWSAELLNEMPAIKRPEPFTNQRHVFKSRQPRWNGSASTRPTTDRNKPSCLICI
ncbi:hypothetical protein ACU4GR_33615 (plasmid) [Methylobacterium oryzae CBMB20]